jgi:hypothetical protein
MKRLNALILLVLTLVGLNAFGEEGDFDPQAAQAEPDYAAKYINEYDYTREETSDDMQRQVDAVVEPPLPEFLPPQNTVESDDFAIRGESENAPSLPEYN